MQSIKRLDVDFLGNNRTSCSSPAVLTHSPPYRQEMRRTASGQPFGLSRKRWGG